MKPTTAGQPFENFGLERRKRGDDGRIELPSTEPMDLRDRGVDGPGLLVRPFDP